jgi:hypothetical protein
MAAVQDRGQFHGAEASGGETSTVNRPARRLVDARSLSE